MQLSPTSLNLQVMVQNDARASSDLVAKAQTEVSRLYGLIGVDIEWVTRVPQNGAGLRVVSLVTWEPPEKALPASVLGITHGRRAYVFVARVERASQKFKASIYNVLATAIAHEIGHTTLPRGVHAKRGLMEEAWSINDVRSASAGMLHFSPEIATLIRRGLIPEVGVTTARRRD